MQITPVLFEQVFTTAEAARIWGVHRGTVVTWVQAGYVRPTRKMPGPNGSYLFTTSEVERIATTPRPRRGRPPRAAVAAA